MAEDKSSMHVSLDSIAGDLFKDLDKDPRVIYRDDPLRYFAERHNFKLPPILEYVFYKVYTPAKDAVDGVGDRTYGLDMIICAARGAGKSLFASILEFSLWYWLDADSINMGGSLHSDTIIITDRGGVAIKDVVIGDVVICSDGEQHKVVGSSVVNNNDQWVELYIYGNNKPTILTADHKVLTQRGFVPAIGLSQSDYVILQGVNDCTYVPKIEWDVPNSCDGKYRNKLADLQSVNFHHPDFYRLVGYYIAEGCSGGSNGKGIKHGSIAFSLSAKNDIDIINDLKVLIPRYMLADARVYEKSMSDGSVTMVRCASSAFRKFFGQFGSDATHKKLPYEWLRMDNNCIRQLIRGLWLGDGHIRNSKNQWNYKRAEAGYTTTSVQLAIWIRMALTKLGISSAITKEKLSSIKTSTTIKFKNVQPYRYNIRVCGSAFYKLMTTILNEDASWVWSRSNKPYDVFGYEKSRSDGNKILYKVKSVKKVKEKYAHYDIRVEGMHDFCTLNGIVHNSEDQATIVYNYVCSYIDADAEVGKVVDKRTMSMTTKKGQSPTPELRCITASAKQVRGKHPGARRKAPGLLVVDEAAEVLDGLMKQALPMTKEARPPFNLIISTFHHAFGDFQEFWDNAEARGFVKLSLDSFDVCEKCADDCSKCIPEFDETYCQLVCGCYYDYSKKPEDRPSWHRYYYEEKFDYVRPEMMPKGCVSPEPCNTCPVKDGCTAPKLRIKSVGDLGKECPTCGSIIEHKAKSGAGHFPVEEIRKAWRRNDKVTFEVEYMGWRPGRGIFVLDPYDVDMSLVRETAYSVYGSTRLGIDWGAAGVTAMVVVQYNVDSSIDILDYYDMQAPSDTECYDMVGRLCRRYNISLIYADSSHVFQNTHIRNELGIMITPVNFQTQKELGVGVMRMKFERKLVRIPERFKPTLVRDLKNWRRDANGNILKKNDHGPDSLLCAMIEGAAFSEVISAPPEVEEDLRETSYYSIWDRASF